MSEVDRDVVIRRLVTVAAIPMAVGGYRTYVREVAQTLKPSN